MSMYTVFCFHVLSGVLLLFAMCALIVPVYIIITTQLENWTGSLEGVSGSFHFDQLPF